MTVEIVTARPYLNKLNAEITLNDVIASLTVQNQGLSGLLGFFDRRKRKRCKLGIFL